MSLFGSNKKVEQEKHVDKNDFDTLSERLTRAEKRVVDLEGRMLNVEGDADNFRNKVLRKIQRRNQEEEQTIEAKPIQVGFPNRR